MLMRNVVAITAVLVPLSAIAVEAEFPLGIQHGYPFCIAGPDDTILMAYRIGKTNQVEVARSADTGLTWEVLSQVNCFDPVHYFGGHMTRMSDDSIVMVVKDRDLRLGWIRSTDGGRSWSEFVHIPLEWKFKVFAFGPLYEMSDGRWAYATYAQNDRPKSEGPFPMTTARADADSLIVWSEDQGKTWSEPISIPDPEDGNNSLNEIALLEYKPGKFLAAMRTDETFRRDDNKIAGFCGFYFSRSNDGINWSEPQPTGDIGRQPHFYRIGETFVLAYRQYAPYDRTGYATIRFSRNGLTWSRPFRIHRGVQDGPNIVQAGGLVVAFNQLAPTAEFPTRQVIEIPDEREWFLSPIVKP